MASAVDICNIALSLLGDEATVASISPPEGSAQAQHCATFYPIALNALLESHNWRFCTSRKCLARLSSAPLLGWAYAYGLPHDMLRAISVCSAAAGDDLRPEPFEVEVLPTRVPVLYCNVSDAVLRYTLAVSDPAVFSPLFVDALAASLAAYLAGPVLKGDAGAQMARYWYSVARDRRSAAVTSDANQRRVLPDYKAPWVAGR